jgi:hypothetical protein
MAGSGISQSAGSEPVPCWGRARAAGDPEPCRRSRGGQAQVVLCGCASRGRQRRRGRRGPRSAAAQSWPAERQARCWRQQRRRVEPAGRRGGPAGGTPRQRQRLRVAARLAAGAAEAPRARPHMAPPQPRAHQRQRGVAHAGAWLGAAARRAPAASRSHTRPPACRAGRAGSGSRPGPPPLPCPPPAKPASASCSPAPAHCTAGRGPAPGGSPAAACR